VAALTFECNYTAAIILDRNLQICFYKIVPTKAKYLLGGKMNDSTQLNKQRTAICAFLSLALLLLGYLLASVGQGSDSRHGMYLGLLIRFCGGFGLLFAVASILRREKPAVLSWLALVLSFAPYILVFLTNTLNIKL
jgi:hypothetical protein